MGVLSALFKAFKPAKQVAKTVPLKSGRVHKVGTDSIDSTKKVKDIEKGQTTESMLEGMTQDMKAFDKKVKK